MRSSSFPREENLGETRHRLWTLVIHNILSPRLLERSLATISLQAETASHFVPDPAQTTSPGQITRSILSIMVFGPMNLYRFRGPLSGSLTGVLSVREGRVLKSPIDLPAIGFEESRRGLLTYALPNLFH